MSVHKGTVPINTNLLPALCCDSMFTQLYLCMSQYSIEVCIMNSCYLIINGCLASTTTMIRL